MYTHSRWTGALLSVLMISLTACGKNDQARTDSAAMATGAGMAATKTDSGAMGGMPARSGTDSMPAMTGMSGPAAMPGMSAEMTAHMAEMKGADGAKMKSMLPDHRKMVAGMLATMNDQMKSMKMSATPAWTALTDSIRSDLKAMPAMSASALAAMMPAHEMRMMNLATMHEGMMKSMK